MSQRSEKLRRQVAALREDVDELQRRQATSERFSAALHSVTSQADRNTAALLAAERKKAGQAERTAAMWRRMVYAALVASIIVEIIAITVINVKAEDTAPIDPPAGVTVAESAKAAAVDLLVEEPENEKIEAALLSSVHKIENCTVTWYTADTCNKKPGDPAYGVTASGLPVVENLTCAVDKSVIPLYSDVFV